MSATRRFVDAVLGASASGVACLVIVTHLAPGADVLLRAVHRLLPIAALIPKPHSIDERVRQRVAARIPLLPTTRADMLRDPARFLAALQEKVGERRFAVIDTGGYFAPLLLRAARHFGGRLLGVVEDTENGHQKYQRLLATLDGGRFPCPVASVARSDLKKPEDFLVGQAIVFSAEALLREQGTVLTGKRAAVLGYGKIGASIAQNLHCKSASVEVIDTDAVRQVLALAHGFHTGRLEQVLARVELLFCATGNRALKAAHLAHLRRGAYVFTATSGDDEIEGHGALLHHCTPCRRGSLARVALGSTRFYLCNRGNAVNFLHGGIVGDYLKLVQAEFLYTATQLPAMGALDCIQQLDEGRKRFIAELWLKHFRH